MPKFSFPINYNRSHVSVYFIHPFSKEKFCKMTIRTYFNLANHLTGVQPLLIITTHMLPLTSFCFAAFNCKQELLLVCKKIQRFNYT